MQPKPKKMRINVNGQLNKAIVTLKDVVLYIIHSLPLLAQPGIS